MLVSGAVGGASGDKAFFGWPARAGIGVKGLVQSEVPWMS